MGYSLSIALPTKRACDTLHAWLGANFRPYCTALKGWESDYTSLQRHPSYRPRPGKSFGSVTGFDYSCGGAERLYVWEVAKLIARLAGARLYYDYEVIEDASLASEDWERDLAYEDNPAEDKKLICAEIVRLEQLWKAKPPV
jgi:hypothetical protein